MTEDDTDWEEVERMAGHFGCPPTFKVYAIECQRGDVTRVIVEKATFPEESVDKWRKDGWYVIMLGQTFRLTEDEADEVLAEVTKLTPVKKREWAKAQADRLN